MLRFSSIGPTNYRSELPLAPAGNIAAHIPSERPQLAFASKLRTTSNPLAPVCPPSSCASPVAAPALLALNRSCTALQHSPPCCRPSSCSPPHAACPPSVHPLAPARCTSAPVTSPQQRNPMQLYSYSLPPCCASSPAAHALHRNVPPVLHRSSAPVRSTSHVLWLAPSCARRRRCRSRACRSEKG